MSRSEPVERVSYSVEEFAAAHRLSKATVYRLIESGAIPVLRLGKSIRIPDDAYRNGGAS